LHGRLAATPLLIGLVFLEATDIVFAVDSVPAIFAITHEPLIVFTSNIFAILGLRAMYFMLAGAVDKFHLLQYGLGVVLVFVGLKMVWLNDLFGGKFPITISLGVIALVIAMSIVVSLLFPKRSEEAVESSNHLEQRTIAAQKPTSSDNYGWRNKGGVSRETLKLLWKVVALYLLLMGLGLILATALQLKNVGALD